MANYLGRAAKRAGSGPKQSEPLNERQVINSAGGYVFEVSNWTKLDRFLILGTEGGTYYVNEQKLTEQNVKHVKACIAEDGLRVVSRIVEISTAGRAPKNDPALFCLALCTTSTDDKVKAAAYAALPQVARIGTHLFHFADYVNATRGWGRGLRTAIANWYTEKTPNSLQNQLVKYQSRDGWSHKDLLKLSHPVTNDGMKEAAFRWVISGTDMDPRNVRRGKPEDSPVTKYDKLHASYARLDLINAFEQVKEFALDANKLAGKTDAEKTALVSKHVKDNEKSVSKLVAEYQLTREMVPTEFQNSKMVWEALFEKMPLTAMIRNLANLTRADLLKPMSAMQKEVVKRVTDEENIKKSKVHPFQMLLALKTYASGKGFRSQGAGWTPVQQVVDALDEGFYLSFNNVAPTGKRFYIGLDVSGSMSSTIQNTNLSAAEGAAALAMITARTESDYVVRAFTSIMSELNISPRQRLDDIVQSTRNANFGRTDCALPMLDALQRKIPVDVFEVITDSETWVGAVHPVKALEKYRKEMGINAKLVVVGMTASNFSIADPEDPGMLDIVGFDASIPVVMGDFAKQ